MTSPEMKDPITLPREEALHEAVCDAAVEAGILGGMFDQGNYAVSWESTGNARGVVTLPTPPAEG